MEPRHARMDPLGLLVTQLDLEVSHPVYAGTEASMDPARHGPVSVLQVSAHAPAGRLTRWSFAVTVVAMTYAATPGEAFQAHGQLADTILDLTTVDNGAVKVSSVVSELEPEDIPVRSATDWPGLMSTYSMYLRRKG